MLTKYYDTMLTKPFDALDPFRLLDDVYGPSWNLKSSSSSYRVNTTDVGLELSTDLPGVKSKDLSVQVTGRTVSVFGKLRGEDFKHSYRVSRDYDVETASASLEDGVLTLTFEKSSTSQPRTIDIVVK